MFNASCRNNITLQSGIKSIAPTSHMDEKDSRRITKIWNGLAWRSSTRPDDQPLIKAAKHIGRYLGRFTISRPDALTTAKYKRFATKFDKVQRSEPEKRWL